MSKVSAIEAKCTACNHHLFDDVWGEYNCKKKGRVCTKTELAMGCSDFEKLGTMPSDPKPELVVRSGATFTPSVSESGVLSWTNDKDLANPKPVNIKGPQGDTGATGATGPQGPKGDPGVDGRTPVKGIDYYTPSDMQALADDLWGLLKENMKIAKIGTVNLLASAWVGEGNLYSQVVTVDGATENSQVDLTPDVQQLAVFYEKDLTFVTENDGGVITVYAIGQKPANDYTIQVTITEVDV